MKAIRFKVRPQAHTTISRYISVELQIKCSDYTSLFSLNVTPTNWLLIRYYSVDK